MTSLSEPVAHWPMRVWFALWRLVVLMSVSWRLRVGSVVGHLLYYLAARRRKIAQVNLALCFPQLEEKERQGVLRGHFQSLGMAMMEVALCWWGRDEQLRGMAEVHGQAHLEHAMAQGHGVLLLSAHFTTLEIAGHILSQWFPFVPMYRAHKSPAFEYEMRRAREQRFGAVVERGDMRRVIRLLKQGSIVWYGPDQDYGLQHSRFVPFFGVPAATLTATPRIAAISGAAVVPYFPVRDAQGRYQLHILPALDNFPSGDEQADLTRINGLIETAIMRCPEQYLWSHRRFKNRPQGCTPVYQKG